MVQQEKHRPQIIVDMLFFKTQEIGCDLSLMKISYNLTKRTTKTEKFENYLKLYIINFKTKGYELTASGSIIISILNYKLKRLVRILRLHKEQKTGKNSNFKKKIEREKCRRHYKMIFSLKTSLCSNNFLTEMEFFCFYQNVFKKSNMNKYMRATKFLRKLVVSPPLNS